MNFINAVIDAITITDVLVGIATFASVYVAVLLWQKAMENAELISDGGERDE